MLEQKGCGEGRDAGQQWMPGAACWQSPGGTLLPVGLPAWALARSHPASCHSMAIQMALVPSTRPGDLLGQGGILSTTPDGLRHPLR